MATATIATKRPQPIRWPKGDDGLTDKERETWRIMLGYQDEHGVAMSVYDVGRALGVSSFGTVHARVNRLVGLGLVSKHRTGSRHKYLAVSATPREAEALVTSAEVAAIEAAADLIAVEAYRQGVPKATGRRRVSQHITLSGQQKEYDDDNAWKLLLDSLKLAGQLKDDSRAWCERGAVSYSRGDRTATVITLEDVR